MKDLVCVCEPIRFRYNDQHGGYLFFLWSLQGKDGTVTSDPKHGPAYTTDPQMAEVWSSKYHTVLLVRSPKSNRAWESLAFY